MVRDQLKFEPGSHMCLVYQDLAEQMEVVVPYCLGGLTRKECCVYVVDDRIGSQVMRALTRAGVDVASQNKRGALVLLNKYKAYIQSGRFDPREEIERLQESYQEKLKAGFSGLRVTAEMTWALGAEPGCSRLIEYEAMLNRFLRGKQAMYLCQYNANRFPASVIKEACRIHPKIISNGHVSSRLLSDSKSKVRTTS